MNKLTTMFKTAGAKLTRKASPKFIGLLLALLAVVVVPMASMAWGPDRPTFTMEHPATYPVFNSITNNPKYGDERNFMRVRDVAADDKFGDTESLAAGKEYEIQVFYHNNASTTFNADGSGIAKDVSTRAEIPAIVKAGGAATDAVAYVNASNTNPTSVYDTINFTNSTNGDIALRYIPGSTVVHNMGKINGTQLPDTILDQSGVKLGYDALDGTIPGCNEYSGYVTFRVKADQAAFNFTKQVQLDGTDGWHDSVNAKPGDTVDYLLSYKNVGTVQQKNVVFKDQLPDGLSYVPGTSKLTNDAMSAKVVDDGIGAGGINVGDYDPNGDAYLTFHAKIADDACGTLVNTAYVETDNGWTSATATVNVENEKCKPQECKPGIPMGDTRCNECKPGIPAGDSRCTPCTETNPKGGDTTNSCAAPAEALPTTGPGQVIALGIGLFAVTLGLAYWLRSRRDLRIALGA